MAERYSVSDVLHFLDADLSGEEDSDDDFDGYVEDEDESEEDEDESEEMETDASDNITEGNCFAITMKGYSK